MVSSHGEGESSPVETIASSTETAKSERNKHCRWRTPYMISLYDECEADPETCKSVQVKQKDRVSIVCPGSSQLVAPPTSASSKPRTAMPTAPTEQGHRNRERGRSPERRPRRHEAQQHFVKLRRVGDAKQVLVRAEQFPERAYSSLCNSMHDTQIPNRPWCAGDQPEAGRVHIDIFVMGRECVHACDDSLSPYGGAYDPECVTSFDRGPAEMRDHHQRVIYFDNQKLTISNHHDGSCPFVLLLQLEYDRQGIENAFIHSLRSLFRTVQKAMRRQRSGFTTGICEGMST